jgi:hypothetical protein
MCKFAELPFADFPIRQVGIHETPENPSMMWSKQVNKFMHNHELAQISR